jgi:hypothetical protein
MHPPPLLRRPRTEENGEIGRGDAAHKELRFLDAVDLCRTFLFLRLIGEDNELERAKIFSAES